jgi:hypothetical protein
MVTVPFGLPLTGQILSSADAINVNNRSKYLKPAGRVGISLPEAGKAVLKSGCRNVHLLLQIENAFINNIKNQPEAVICAADPAGRLTANLGEIRKVSNTVFLSANGPPGSTAAN